jgi:hypothetical protein
VSPSALELMTVVHETLDNLLGMELRLPAPLLQRILGESFPRYRGHLIVLLICLYGRDHC